MVSKSFLVKNYMIRLGYEMSAMFDGTEIKARGIIQVKVLAHRMKLTIDS